MTWRPRLRAWWRRTPPPSRAPVRTPHLDPDCPLAAALVPLAAVSGPEALPRDRVAVHHPPTPCTVCGVPVATSTRANRSKRGRVFCSPEHLDAAGHPEPAPRPAPPPPDMPQCPRPDKHAFATEPEAEEFFHVLLAVDPDLHAYPCRCGSWHVGHGPDPANTIAAIARIRVVGKRRTA